MDKKSSVGASSQCKAPNAQRNITEEEVFMKRLEEMSLRAIYETETRNQYGVDQVRFWVKIYRDNVFLAKTSSGFMSKSVDYRELAFDQANRRLNAIAMYNRHLPSSTYNRAGTAKAPAENQEQRDDYTDHRNYY